MSQAKVDRYKEQKANRQKIMKKEKMERLAWKLGGCAALALLVVWVGVSAYGRIHVPVADTYEIKTESVDHYLDGLNAEEE
ncbi:MAG: hypothetical protein Q4B57_07385 [Eubacteriales bacterium]|nr:hypothetical protein [Eubacteriales bacterium]